ncbi:hypothetical protein M1K46_02325 [Fictibacillus sp. WQ 8-8]|uniref:hypothetical protein n=1 Tax=Fictibacillus sp. WQ 8-8 TaxID=2938788 RepID=UPI00210C83A3|nr:hypothetical protein [Fictibacillus sp. WQ 8-8]MCQ6264502.1 hypothetical protein [Fictibacillus sp. WQ 8-8]
MFEEEDHIQVPVLRYIFSEYQYDKEKDLIEIVRMDKKRLKDQEAFILEAYNDKMAADGILTGDRLLVIKQAYIYSHEGYSCIYNQE